MLTSRLYPSVHVVRGHASCIATESLDVVSKQLRFHESTGQSCNLKLVCDAQTLDILFFPSVRELVILAGLAGPRHNSIGPRLETCPNVTWPVQDDEAKKLTSTPSNFGADADTFSCQALTKLCIQGCPTPQLSSTLHRNLPLTRWAPSVRHAVVTWLSLSGY